MCLSSAINYLALPCKLAFKATHLQNLLAIALYFNFTTFENRFATTKAKFRESHKMKLFSSSQIKGGCWQKHCFRLFSLCVCGRYISAMVLGEESNIRNYCQLPATRPPFDQQSFIGTVAFFPRQIFRRVPCKVDL